MTRDWETFWRHHFHSFRVGKRLWIIPAWEDPPLRSTTPDMIPIKINPGLSFGTGDHFTTRFCLEMIEKFAGHKPRTFLDVGTGSGILAIAAARLGYTKIEGIDIDPQCIEQARKNAALNPPCDKKITFKHSDIIRQRPEKNHTVVCANLYKDLLQQGAASLYAAASEYLILTGIRDADLDELALTYLNSGGREIVRDGDGEWGGLVFSTRS